MAPRMWPVTTSTGRAWLASTASTVRAIMGVPCASGSSSLLRGAMRLDRPAASTMAAMRGGGAAASRGTGLAANSFSNPPTPMRAMSALPAGSPANRRASRKSMPFNAGLRAQPGSTTAGTLPI
jgi:hypothetical protein